MALLQCTAAKWRFLCISPLLTLSEPLPLRSAFTPGGFFPPGTTSIEKRTIAGAVPVWEAEKCSQCNICSYVCPHACVRPVRCAAVGRAGGLSAGG